MSQKEIREILLKYKVLAIVGLSRHEDKPSYEVAKYMKSKGYRIVPINPHVDEVLGETSYKSLLECPLEIQKTIDIVNIFRRAEDVLEVVEQAVKLRIAVGTPYVVWMQLGIANEEAAEAAHKAGLTVVMDKCIMVEHKRLSIMEK